MSKELLLVIEAVANEKGVPRQVILEAMEAALASAAKKRYPEQDVACRVSINPKDGNYETQPKAFRTAAVFFGIATSGGTLAHQKLAPTRELADKLLDQRLAALTKADANDYLYQWDSSRDYNPAPGLERIEVPLLAINAADDERTRPRPASWTAR